MTVQGLAPVGRSAAPLREQVIAALRHAILNFELQPGQRLVERELIERLEVSRTTVREAIRELASEGLVTVVPQKGAMVSAPSVEDAKDLYEVRAALESLVVRRFIERATPAQVDRLDRAVEDFAAVSARTDDIRVTLETKDKFYEVLLEGADSEVLLGLIDQIQSRVRVLRATSMGRPGRMAESVRELRGIVAAVRRGDKDEASRLCTEHIWGAARSALSSLLPTSE
ncbi:GntR family transcriptional regulator [Georgenia sp. SYP-B2076]|uniref:GntR family transcriptional regulator n=1 Tax=Georgenia sp. SYP-B2076 TaxID=2495881 RepID=UPI00197A8427|nr:GntR family transcriptional regulator [Georgenia sp. SYP-B2076]